MIPTAAIVLLLAFDAQAQPAEPPQTSEPAVTAPAPAAEPIVRATLEELRKAELVQAADEMAPRLAQSFTHVDRTGRVSGAFAYLEPMRRARARKATVKELRFDNVLVRVYGGSAIASYRYRKVSPQGVSEGWASDVFELRDDGAWILVHRHRG